MNSRSQILGVYPSMGRGGLGNMLLPWARALVYAQTLNAPMLEPHWWRPRLGPYLRRENDKRQYHRMLSQPSVVQLARSWGMLLGHHRVTEEKLSENKSLNTNKPCILVVKGMTGLFEPILSSREMIKAEFFARARDRQRSQQPNPYFAMHVRLGDFSAPAIAPKANTSTPMDWFLALAHRLHEHDSQVRIKLCSDGSRTQLRPLLDLPWIDFQARNAAVDDLMTLSQAECIIGSNSTFSAWGAFLGKGEIFFAPGENQLLRFWPKAREVGPAESPFA